MDPVLCEVTLSNRLLATMGQKGSGRKTKSYLRVVTNDGTKVERFIQHFTNQNRQGQLYKIKNNILGVFTRFIHEGRSTIQFKVPPVDMIIQQADQTKLKEFILNVRHGPSLACGDVSHSNESVASYNGTLKKLKIPVFQKTITKRCDYPTDSDFPSTLTHLKIQYISLTRIEARIGRLKALQTLDLTGNKISKIPAFLGNLSLKELILSQNDIQSIPAILFEGAWRRSLRLLDLRDNKVRFLPRSFCRLSELVSLKLDRNKITDLPQSIGELKNLSILSLSGNLLNALPYRLVSARLQELSINDNPLEHVSRANETVLIKTAAKFPSLLELSARTVANAKMVLTPEDVPGTLLDLLNYDKLVCYCGGACFTSYSIVQKVYSNLLAIGAAVSSNTRAVPFHIILCSQKCMMKFMTIADRNIFL